MRKISVTVQPTEHTVLPLGPYDLADPMLLRYQYGQEHCLQPLGASVSELQDRSLGFWSQALPSSADNYSSLQNSFWPDTVSC